jgi:hypothetical protein
MEEERNVPEAPRTASGAGNQVEGPHCGEGPVYDESPGPGEGERVRRKILVVGTGANFSQRLIEYAAWFAKRMDYDMVALNCVPFGGDAPEELSPYTDELKKRFESGAARGAELLAYRAESDGIRFTHLVRYGSSDSCVRELYHELQDVEYVLMDPLGNDDDAEVDERMCDISVFSYSE